MGNIRKTEMLELVCVLTEEEIQARAFDASMLDHQIQSKELAFDVARKEHKAEVEEFSNKRRNLLREIRERQTRRDVECVVERVYHPDFVVRCTRTDTGEIVNERPMTSEERQSQLFELEARSKVN